MMETSNSDSEDEIAFKCTPSTGADENASPNVAPKKPSIWEKAWGIRRQTAASTEPPVVNDSAFLPDDFLPPTLEEGTFKLKEDENEKENEKTPLTPQSSKFLPPSQSPSQTSQTTLSPSLGLSNNYSLSDLDEHAPIYSKTELQMKINTEMSSLKLSLSQAHAKQIAELKSSTLVATNLQTTSSSNTSSQLQATIDDLQGQLKGKNDEMVSKEKEHDAIWEEMISRLDGFEKEHNEKLQQSEQVSDLEESEREEDENT